MSPDPDRRTDPPAGPPAGDPTRVTAAHPRTVPDAAPDAASGDAARSALAGLLRLEAHRASVEGNAGADPARLADGWERRCVVDGVRAEELVRLYRELGFEVAADPVSGTELGGEHCEDCRLVAMLRFRVIYTRHPRDT